jgi:hypothetical protein
MISAGGFPRALPEATLTMAVGQLWVGVPQTQSCAPRRPENGHSGLNDNRR